MATTMDNDVVDVVDAVYDALLSSPPLFSFSPEDSGNSDSSRSSPQHGESPSNDWSRDSKILDDLDSLRMDWTTLGVDGHIPAFISDAPAIDPNALHMSGFHFALTPPNDSSSPHQLPTPNPGSISSRSESPARELAASVNPSDLTLFSQLCQSTRDVTGVTFAIPSAHAPVSSNFPSSATSKMPIPRLRPSNAAFVPPSKSATSMMPPTTPPASVPASSPPAAAPSTGKQVRPKTSHTTIERRYRTNLNARILALRRAVPALRILEKNSPTQTQGRGLTGATAPMWNFNDVVNERGYVDGVKAAKKNSKGIVLGKAVEYIRALKRREGRLRRESDGLRALLAGLVGGPELLREWERGWRMEYGGEEADEVDEDEDDGDIEVDGDFGAYEEESDEDDMRPNKRARSTKPTAPPTEKRKRGRPRKTPPGPPAPAPPASSTAVPASSTLAPDPVPASKPLLAVALIFSIFSPGITPSGSTGTVLTAPPAAQTSGWSVLQALHVLVTVLLFTSLVTAYFPRLVRRVIPRAFVFTSLPSLFTREKKSTRTLNEKALREAVGAKGGISGVVCAALTHILRNGTRGDLRVWRRICEIDLMRGSAAPLFSRLQTYLALTGQKPRAPADSIMLALLAHPFASSSAAAHWADARRAESSSAVEKLVLDMNVDDAAHILAAASSPSISSSSSGSSTSDSENYDDQLSPSPVRLIAAHTVLARAKALAVNTFVATVNGTSPESSDDRVALHGAARELGGKPGSLTRLLERVVRCTPGDILPMLEIEADTCEDVDADIACTYLRATVLFRHAFPLTAPIPGHGTKNAPIHLALRRVLASPAFEMSAETEEARDLIVDMLGDAGRARSGKRQDSF